MRTRQGRVEILSRVIGNRLPDQAEAVIPELNQQIPLSRHRRKEEPAGDQGTTDRIQRALEIRDVVEDVIGEHEIKGCIEARGKACPGLYATR